MSKMPHIKQISGLKQTLDSKIEVNIVSALPAIDLAESNAIYLLNEADNDTDSLNGIQYSEMNGYKLVDNRFVKVMSSLNECDTSDINSLFDNN